MSDGIAQYPSTGLVIGVYLSQATTLSHRYTDGSGVVKCPSRRCSRYLADIEVLTNILVAGVQVAVTSRPASAHRACLETTSVSPLPSPPSPTPTHPTGPPKTTSPHRASRCQSPLQHPDRCPASPPQAPPLKMYSAGTRSVHFVYPRPSTPTHLLANGTPYI